MKNIFSSKLKYGKKLLYLSFLISFSLIAYYHLRSGHSMSSDSVRFSKWADDLIRLKFNFFDFFLIDKTSIRPHLLFFSLPVFLIALCKVFFINDWQFAFLLFNLSLVFFSLLVFTKSLLIIGVRPILISLTLPIIVISVDILTWPKFILSDMIYAFLVILVTYFVIKGIIENKIYYLELFLIIFLLFASRPSSFPVIFSIIFFSIISKYMIFLRPKWILLFLFILFICTPLIYSMIYYLIQSNSYGVVRLDFIVSMVKEGIIIHDRPETWVNKPNNLIDIAHIYFLRLISFFYPYSHSFSMVHITFNVIQIVLIFISISMWSFFGDNKKVKNKIFLFILLLSFFVAAFHSFILIDYDWRYRFPIILPLLMLFPISLEIFFKKIKLK